MRTLLWIVGLFALVVGLTIAARDNPGYVLIMLPAHRVELSLNFAVVLLVVGFAIAYGLIRALTITLRMPALAGEFRRERKRAKARRAFEDAVKAFFEGRFGRAERAAKEALAQDESPALSLAVAARAAHELRSYPRRDEYLQEMERLAPQDSYLRLMTQAELLLDERRYFDALQALSKVKDKHTAALRLELKAQQLARNWDQVLQLLAQLERRDVFEPALLQQLKRYAQTENLKRKALDARTLRSYWDKLPQQDRRDSRIAAAAAQCFIALNDCAQAHAIIEESLDSAWDPSLLPLYIQCLPRDARRHLERAETWLKQHAGDPALLLALGELCMHQELWGKARSYLEASLAVEPSHAAYVQLGRLLERVGKAEEASRVFRQGLELSLGQSTNTSGARSRAAS
ncbi:MAG TPA: heme biosynthesis HemY N-terminal domain-containing protein [Burkholderiales bacterium]|nr:heme biosynthesis HemY N-terminal domain-containing protein [Burkholderiales bacterium]